MIARLLPIAFLAAALVTFAAPSAAQAQGMKVGIVDMKRVFAEYYKTKDAEKKVNDGKAAAKKELDERNAKYKQLLGEYQSLPSSSATPPSPRSCARPRRRKRRTSPPKPRA
ncbi:MAG: OmpH family outer membrane protein [Verrucomicrobiales bacterium]